MIKMSTLFTLILFSISSFSSFHLANAFANHHKNLTPQVMNFYNQSDIYLTANEKLKLQKYHIIFVPGMLSGLGKLVFEKNFNQQKKFFNQIMEDPLFSVIADTNTATAISVNLPYLKKLIDKSDHPVILWGHSKGGLECLELLILYPELMKKVKGIITFQAPFHGSEAADYISGRLILRTLMTTLFKSLGGSYQVMRDFETAPRKEFLQLYRNEINELISKIPFITLVGWLDQLEQQTYFLSWGGLFSGIIFPFGKIVRKQGEIENDYLVTRYSQRLGNADYVEHDSVDHISLVMSSGHNSVDKVKFSLAILKVMLTKLP
ncbi:MAG: hypothetical protein HQK50_06635 [Oligoflexia bacterium]|nr:hypothetical protein [Oligoflexia bacterium]MBF0365229.1 hypothetical protein [Oligoflexia bacterium]